MDTIPEALYQEILSYLIVNSTSLRGIFHKHKSLQFINKTFQRSFIRYLKTKPLRLYITNWDWKNAVKITLQLIQFVKKHDIRIYNLIIALNDDLYDDHFYPPPIIMEAMYGINFISLRRLELQSAGQYFDFNILKDCKELTHFIFGPAYSYPSIDQRTAEKLKNFLSLKRDTLEYLSFPVNENETYNYIFPKDFSWPNLKKISVTMVDIATSKKIESSTLQRLFLNGISCFSGHHCEIVIKCPNLKLLLIDCLDPYYHKIDEIELTNRSCKPYYKEYTQTCHPSELRKIGLVVTVSSDCDIGVKIYKR